MRLIYCFLFLFIFHIAWSAEPADSTKNKLKAGAFVSMNSNGIASIPAFSLDKPAVIASLSLTKNRFSYTPTLAYGLDMRPWFIDNWINYKVVRRASFDLTAAFNISTFGTKHSLEDESFWEAQRYFALAMTGVLRLSSKNTITLAYWRDMGQEKGTLKGHFFNSIIERNDMNIGKNLLLSAAVQVFYIDYTGKNDGLFVSPKISTSINKIPFTLFFQATQAISSNISPFPGFRWNVGLGYTL